MSKEIRYQCGFGNDFSTEARDGALPKNQNSPQKVPHGLYVEQLSGTAFTAPRTENRRSWLYRIQPSVRHEPFKRLDNDRFLSPPFCDELATPNQLRFNPLKDPKGPTDFIDALVTMAGGGSPALQNGVAIHLYAANESMKNRFFYNADADLLIIPQQGRLELRTEFGILQIEPAEIAVIQRGIKFQVCLLDKTARGYVCENFGQAFRLPDLGPIGANGLANSRDFLTPIAAFEDRKGKMELVAKFQGRLWSAELDHSPLDVVAWHGNYAPYKYDLRHFQTINTVSFDHCDPSIFTVLTSPLGGQIGVANIDLTIFPARWMVAEHTFRPPYFHRNLMSEYMGLIYGKYDAKEEGFVPGGGSIHNSMSAHGPDKDTYDRAVSADLKPVYISNTLAFLIETRFVYQPTRFAMQGGLLQKGYYKCWQGLEGNSFI